MADPSLDAAANLSPTFINPNYATPDQIASLRAYATALQQPTPVAHWAQGLNEVARQLIGGAIGGYADRREGQALDATANQSKPAYAAVAGLTGIQPAGAQTPPSAPDTSSMPQNAPPGALPIYQGLIARGFNPAQAAALAGNIQQESGFNPAITNPKEGALGLLQWQGPRLAALQAFASQRGTSPSDPNTQLDFITHEMQGPEAKNAQAFLSSNDVASANANLLPYIRYGSNTGAARLKNAQAFMAPASTQAPGAPPQPGQPPPPTAPFDPNKTYLPPGDNVAAAQAAAAAGPLASQRMTPVIDPKTGAPVAFTPSGPRLPPQASAYGAGFNTPVSFTANGVTYQRPAGPAGLPPNTAAQPPPQAPAPASPPQASPQVAQAVAGMTPEQIAMVMNNPRTTPETKALVSALIMPKTIPGPFGSTYITTLADQAAGRPPRPYMEPGEKGEIKVGDMSIPTVTTGTPQAPVSRFLVPGTPTMPGAAPQPGAPPGTAPAPAATNAGPLPQTVVDLSTQGARLAAQKKGFEDENAKTSDLLSKYKDAGVDARGQLNQIDALAALGNKVGYGITPVVQQELGKFGVQTKGLPDIEAYQSVVNNLIPNLRPPGSGTLKDSEIEAFKSAVGGLMTTVPGRQLIAQNLRLMALYKAQIADIAGDTSLPQDARMAKIQALQAPTLKLTPDEAPPLPGGAQNGPGRMIQPLRPLAGTASEASRLAEARDAIARGAPRDAVSQRLQSLGIDPSKL